MCRACQIEMAFISKKESKVKTKVLMNVERKTLVTLLNRSFTGVNANKDWLPAVMNHHSMLYGNSMSQILCHNQLPFFSHTN